MTSVRCDTLSVTLEKARILNGVQLPVESGEWLTIVGPNGAGKSTLMQALAGLVPYDGTVTFDGRDARELGRRERARTVALCPQQPVVPPGMTVREYVLLGRTAHLPLYGREGAADRTKVASLLARLELSDKAHRILATLSGGERQRCILARGLAQEAPVLLLDEPTTGLDIGFQQQVLDLVAQVMKSEKLTVVATMHDLTLAGVYADRIALLLHGRVARHGTPRDVLSPEHLSEAFGGNLTLVEHDGTILVIPVPKR